ncbi:hypothetical protein [Salinicola sp. DM10]|uniref:hypothetical protein n=1 Tax=Salinicola sp. DM10 TaxID=2815721 RepID=UPI001A8D2000|nr:hypothetical protein [Salinicola sp. DM10]MCE3025721.1 hypothetical protein [Salinicola sp. DM10]
MSFGIRTWAPGGELGFELTTRLTKLILQRDVESWHSGSIALNVPQNMEFTAQAIPLDSDQYMRHVGHRLTYDSRAKVLSWEPGLTQADLDYVNGLADWARPMRSASRIVVFAYVPE